MHLRCRDGRKPANDPLTSCVEEPQNTVHLGSERAAPCDEPKKNHGATFRGVSRFGDDVQTSLGCTFRIAEHVADGDADILRFGKERMAAFR